MSTQTPSTSTKGQIARAIISYVKPERLPWIFGPDYKDLRQAVLWATTGTKPPRSKCGITAMMNALYEVFPVKPDCISAQEKELAANINAAATQE